MDSADVGGKLVASVRCWIQDRTLHVEKLIVEPAMQNLARQRNSRWYEFWQNLKEGYDFFEENGYNPSDVGVSNRRYVFHPVWGTEGE